MTDLDREISRIKDIILIHEGKQDLLREYHRDQKFNVDGFGKNIAEAYLDWIEDKGKYGELSASRMTFDEGLKSGLRNAVSLCSDNVDEQTLYKSITNGLANDFYTGHIENSRGLLYVEREIEVPQLTKWDKDSSYYDNLIQKYENNVGGCWSWEEGNASAYYGENGNSTIDLKGWIRMEDVNWAETDYINSPYYVYPHETEVRTKPNALIEVYEISTSLAIKWDEHGRNLPTVDDKGKKISEKRFKTYKLPLKGSILVHATYFGNGGKYNGDYAPVFDAVDSNNQKWMDRQGNVFNRDALMNNKMADMLAKLKNGADPNKLFSYCDTDEETGYLFVIFNGLCNFIKPNGDLLSKQWFDDANEFHNGYAKVFREVDDKCNFIDMNGNVISNAWFDDAEDFENGKAKVELRWKTYYINGEGKIIASLSEE